MGGGRARLGLTLREGGGGAGKKGRKDKERGRDASETGDGEEHPAAE
jgi:hypothetical protein